MEKTCFCEDIASDCGVGVNEIISECGTDSATWRRDELPNTETLRRMILLADWASREPKRWAAYRLYYIDGLTCSQRIAEKLHVAERTVRKWLEPVRLGPRGKRITGGVETTLIHTRATRRQHWKPKDKQ